jgi:hypothetical protein
LNLKTYVDKGSSLRFQINLEEVYSKLRKLKDPTFKPKEGNPYEARDNEGV